MPIPAEPEPDVWAESHAHECVECGECGEVYVPEWYAERPYCWGFD